MPLKILRQDIIYMNVDAIVSSVSQHPYIGFGGDVNSRIHNVAGPYLFYARQRLGEIHVSEAQITPGYQLLARYVIHAHAPNYFYNPETASDLLNETYRNCLELAKAHSLKSIGFPLLSTGVYGYPKEEALDIAKNAINDFLKVYDIDVYLIVYDDESYEVAKKYSQKITDYLNKNFKPVEFLDEIDNLEEVEDEEDHIYDEIVNEDDTLDYDALKPLIKKANLNTIDDDIESSFSDLFLEFIRDKNIDIVKFYKNAMISKQTISKFSTQENYQPKRETVFLCAIGLKLDIEETKKLLASAGYAINPSSKFELIIQYFIESKIYNFHEIDTILLQYDQKTLRNYD